MFGKNELDKLVSAESLDKKKDEKLPVSLNRPRVENFVPTVDKSKEVYIHRRRRNRGKGRKNDENAEIPPGKAKLFQDESDDEGLEGEKDQGDTEKSTVQAATKRKEESDEDSSSDDEEILEAKRKLLKKRLLAMRNSEGVKGDDANEQVKDNANVPAAETDSDSDIDMERRKKLIRERLKQRDNGEHDDSEKASESSQTVLNEENSALDRKSGESLKADQQNNLSKLRDQQTAESASGSSSSSESSDSSDSSSSDEEESIKLTFVPKNKRFTILQAEKSKEEEEIEQAKLEAAAEEQKRMAAEIVKQARREEEEKQKRKEKEKESAMLYARAGMPDDTDGLDEEAEYEAWKVREIKRLQRDMMEKYNLNPDS